MSTDTYKLVGLVFDVIAAIVSLLDFTTDLIILITWYYQDRMIFFYISLSILILAQLSYVIIFYYNHGTWDPLCHSFLSVLCTLPFTPILSFIFYFVAHKDSKLRVFLDKFICFNFHWTSNYVDSQASPQQQYLDDKIYKHLGFVFEALIEAFPQSILQLTAIVYYNEPHLISILSILISMTSVCSKIFLLVITGNLFSWKMKAFVWLSFVVDFFGIFFIVSYAFYQPTNHDLLPYFTYIRSICIWQTIICLVPFAAIGSIGLHLYWTIKLTDEVAYRFLFGPLIAIGITFLWVIGLFVTFLVMIIFCVLWANMAILGMSISNRTPYDKTAKTFYTTFIRWILHEAHDTRDAETNDVLISAAQDRLLKICVLNKFVLEQPNGHNGNYANGRYRPPQWQNYADKTHLEYLCEQEKTRFANVCYQDLRMSCNYQTYQYQPHVWTNKHRHPFFIQAFYYDVYAPMLGEFKNKWNNESYCRYGVAVAVLYYLTWIAAPIYFLSRIGNVLLPLFIVLYLGGDNVNLFTDLDTFQVIMWISYGVLLGIWFVLAVSVMKDTFILWHILPSTGYLKATTVIEQANKVEREIKEYYFGIVEYPVIAKIVSGVYGDDISAIILHYFKNIELTEETDNTMESHL
eukprot:174457_1